MPSLVTSGELAIHPDLGLVVHRAERQVQPRRSPGRGEPEHAAVPNDRVVASLLDAARRGLGWKGDEDLPVEDFGAPRPTFLDPTILVVEGKAPGTPQIGPPGPAELGLGVLGRCPINGCIQRWSPRG